MGFQCGIVGLPNVGKSTLFNALTRTADAAAENYPFCTIEPNVGRVPVPEPRVHEIGRVAGSPQIIETQLSFVDIAGLVRGASTGEGLGNQFLSNIREVDAIVHVLRCFDDDDVSHVEGSIDPVRDAETVETELMLADLESLERRVTGVIKKARGDDKEARATQTLMEETIALLSEGKPARLLRSDDAEKNKALRQLYLLSSKRVLYVANVGEADAAGGNAASQAVGELAGLQSAGYVVISAGVEAEIIAFDEEERQEYLASLGLRETGLDQVIRAGFDILDLISFFTSGPNESRAWTLRKGMNARQAAGSIHTDFARGFIRAETISYDDFITLGGEQGAKEAGKMRLEGRDYIVKDGDIMLFRFAT